MLCCPGDGGDARVRDHVPHCVEHAIASGDKKDQRRKVAEIMEVLGQAD